MRSRKVDAHALCREEYSPNASLLPVVESPPSAIFTRKKRSARKNHSPRRNAKANTVQSNWSTINRQQRIMIFAFLTGLLVFRVAMFLWTEILIFQSDRPLARRAYEFPPLNEVILDDGNITKKDISWLLQFAVLGFPKCGTSTMMKYLAQHSEIRISQVEQCMKTKTILALYLNSYPGGDFLQGLKCPRHIESEYALQNYEKYFPNTAFIIGVRHPLLWFESFYNFRVNNLWEMPNPKELIKSCEPPFLCTGRGAFHIHLANLGKTNLSKDERLLFPANNIPNQTIDPTHRRIFIYDVEQLHDKNQTRTLQFRKDLQAFLGVSNELPPMLKFSPGMKHNNETLEKELNRMKIDVCDDIPELKLTKHVLISQASNASIWIRQYFLNNPDVFVSSRDYFEEILSSWGRDPCNNRNPTNYSILALRN